MTAGTLLSRRMIPEVDGLRGLAILAVFFTHFWPSTGVAAWARPIAAAGWVGVDLFFVVSGFLIMGILIDTRGGPGFYRNFYMRRVLRIFPLYYAFLLAVFLVMPLLQGASYADSAFGQQAGSPAWYLLYLTNFREVMVEGGVPPFIRPLWSLAIEEQFYLVFPFLVAVLSPRGLQRLLGWLIVGALAFRLLTLWAWPLNHHVQYLLTPARFDTIAMGGLGAVLLRSRAMERWREVLRWGPLVAAALLAIVGWSTGFLRPAPALRGWGYSVIALAFALVVMWAIVFAGSERTGLLRMAWLRYLGRRCYALYVLHIGAALIATRGVGFVLGSDVSESWFRFPLQVAASVVAAELSWRVLERPILRLKSRFAYRSVATVA